MREIIVLICLGLLTGCASKPSNADIMLRGHAESQARKGGVCEIHHIPMEKKVVQVSYGYPMRDDKYVAAMARGFPNAEEDVNGGCDPSDGPRKASVFVCPECTRAQLQWALKHPKNWEAEIILRERKV